jgi:hypothetical protein
LYNIFLHNFYVLTVWVSVLLSKENQQKVTREMWLKLTSGVYKLNLPSLCSIKQIGKRGIKPKCRGLKANKKVLKWNIIWMYKNIFIHFVELCKYFTYFLAVI